MYHVLEQYKVIGLDIDETLINGVASGALRDWVLRNGHRELHLITFRTGNWLAEAIDELQVYGYPRHLWKKLHGIDPHVSYAYSWVRGMMRRAADEDHLHEMFRAEYLSMSDVEKIVLDYHHWKAKTCHENGIDVLVDDRDDLVEEGLKHYGITYIHPRDLVRQADPLGLV